MFRRTTRPSHRTAPTRRPRPGRRALAGVAVVVVAAATVGACSSNSSTASSDTKSPFSITVPPGAVVNGTTADLNAGSVPDAGGSGLDSGPATSVAPGNEDFCMIIQRAGATFSGPATGAANDAQVLAQIKDTFQKLTDSAPGTIKPEITGMNNIIQAMSSPDDIQKMDDPEFTNEQAAVAKWVQDNCGIEIGG
jgi:hypothetical protein